MKKYIPRVMVAAPKSGAGKTIVTCGILQALKGVRPHPLEAADFHEGSDPLLASPHNFVGGQTPLAFKCGPDYIDPMFHREVLGIDSWNLDLFLCGSDYVHNCLVTHASRSGGVSILEGVMGYYDGLGGVSDIASSYAVAKATKTPVILVIDARGCSLSMGALIRGFQNFRSDSRILGVILNRISEGMYARMKDALEREIPIRVLGYLPEREELGLESRYLGLKLPGEIEDIKKYLEELGQQAEKTLDLRGILEIASQAPPLELPEITVTGEREPVTISVAKDEAFCFRYQDNLEILASMGARLRYFSPLHDRELPEGTEGILLYGGYPELYARQLCENVSMRNSIRQAIQNGIPCMAECGGFQYLQEYLRTDTGTWSMAGVLEGGSYPAGRSVRFGYVTLTGGKAFGRGIDEIPAHEFHYYDSENCGSDFLAKKPLTDRSWNCMVSRENILAGYPHIHYGGCPELAEAYLDACRRNGGKE